MTKVAENVLRVTSTLIYLQFDETGSSESLVSFNFFRRRKPAELFFLTDKPPESKRVDACCREGELPGIGETCLGISSTGQITGESSKR